MRVLRFTAQGGGAALDPDGGLLLAEADTIRSPVVSSSGSEFLVLWAEPVSDSETLFLQRLAADGVLLGDEPVAVTQIPTGTPFDLASTDTTVGVADCAQNDAGTNCIRLSWP